MTVKYPDTANLTRSAMDAAKCATAREFSAHLNGAVSERTVHRWLAGDIAATGLAHAVLRHVRAGGRMRR